VLQDPLAWGPRQSEVTDRALAATGESGLEEAILRAAVAALGIAVVALLVTGKVHLAIAASRQRAVRIAEYGVAGVVARLVGQRVGDPAPHRGACNQRCSSPSPWDPDPAVGSWDPDPG
jgi:hypothetical protein